MVEYTLTWFIDITVNNYLTPTENNYVNVLQKPDDRRQFLTNQQIQLAPSRKRRAMHCIPESVYW